MRCREVRPPTTVPARWLLKARALLRRASLSQLLALSRGSSVPLSEALIGGRTLGTAARRLSSIWPHARILYRMRRKGRAERWRLMT